MKQMKVLLICSLIILVLLSAMLFFLMRPQQVQDPQIQATQPQISVFPENLHPKAITVNNSLGGFTATESNSPCIEGLAPQWTDLKDISALFNEMSNASLTFIKQTQDVSEFGLTSPIATVTVRYESDTLTLEVGGVVTGQDARYARLPNSDIVYSWRNASIFTGNKEEFIPLELTPTASAVSEGPKSVTFGGSCREKPLTLAQATDSELWVISSEDSKSTKQDVVDKTVMRLWGLSADSAALYMPTEEQLAEYGLDTPYSTAEFTYLDSSGKEQSVKICASAPVDGQVFLTLNDRPIIYSVHAEKLSWLDLQYQQVRSNLPTLFPITSVERVDLSGPDFQKAYTITHTGNQFTVMDQDGHSVEESIFRKFYQCLIGIPGEAFSEELPPENAPELLRITFHFSDGQNDVIICLQDCPPLQAYITVDGETEFLTKAAYAGIICENIERLTSGQEILPLY